MVYDFHYANLKFMGFWKVSKNRLAGIQSQLWVFALNRLAAMNYCQAKNVGLLCFGCFLVFWELEGLVRVSIICDARQINQFCVVISRNYCYWKEIDVYEY